MTADHVLSLDEATHTYRLDGRPLISVTQALNEGGFGSWQKWCEPAALEYASALGRAVHDAIHFYEEGSLDIDSIDPAVMPRLQAYEKFLLETGAVAIATEQRVHNTLYGYAGTDDWNGLFDDEKAIIDYKSGVVHPSVGLQLAGYCGCFPAPSTFRRFSLQLRSDATYRLHEYPRSEFREEFGVFCGQVAAANWKRRKGIR